eukprot:3216134-Prymnesium_polylepis.1
MAALGFTKTGKGCLFLFSKIEYLDLLDSNLEATMDDDTIEMPGPRGAGVLDRQFMLVWGSQEPSSRCRFTASFLASKFIGGSSLELEREVSGCSRERFPLVLCCDPSGAILPDAVADTLKGAKMPPADESYTKLKMRVTLVTV